MVLLASLFSRLFPGNPALDVDLLTDFREVFSKEFGERCNIEPSLDFFVAYFVTGDRFYIDVCGDVYHVSDHGETAEQFDRGFDDMQDVAKVFPGAVVSKNPCEIYFPTTKENILFAARKMLSFFDVARDRL